LHDGIHHSSRKPFPRKQAPEKIFIITSVNYTDDELLHALKQGGTEERLAEERLFLRFSYFVREGMQKYRLDEAEALDAYTDAVLAFLQAFRKNIFEGRSSVKTYLYQVFNNKCVDLVRKKTTKKYAVHHTVSLPEMLSSLSDSAKLIIQKLAEKADMELLQQKLQELGDNCRKLLLLSADGNTDRQIAAMLEYKTADVVKVSRLRCLEKLRLLYHQMKL